MRSRSNLSIRFVLATNLPGSVTRITAETASVLVRWGIPVTVVFPVVDWLDFKLFEISRLRPMQKLRWALSLAREVVVKGLLPRRWCGFSTYQADPAIRTIRFLRTPPLAGLQQKEMIVVHHLYLVPHMLVQACAHQSKIVGVVHINYQQAIQSPCSESSAWIKYCVAVLRSINIPWFAVSEEARRSAEEFGIPIQRVIHNGVDLEKFRPGIDPTKRKNEKLRVTLFCATNVQKGQRIGAEAISSLKGTFPEVFFSSLGTVLPEYRSLFDHDYGFLNGQAYVKALQETDIFVYPSLWDGFPAPPLEGMACGCAVITTDVEGVTEYAVGGENCLLVERGNVKMLRDRIVQLIQDESLRQKLRHAAPITAQNLGVEQSAEKLLDFLAEVYDSHSVKSQPRIVEEAMFETMPRWMGPF